MNAMSVDMNTTGNTSSAIPSIESCARLNPNGTQDADESGIDILTFDVTAQGVPAFNDGGTPGNAADDTGGIIADSLDLAYPSGFTIQSDVFNNAAVNILARNAMSSLFGAGDVPPDSDGSFFASALDTGTGIPESGDGVLHRITIAATGTTVDGIHPLGVTNNVHLDASGAAFSPTLTNNGSIAVNQDCV